MTIGTSPLLVTGAGGQLGHDLVPAARRAGFEVYADASRDLDITSTDAVEARIAELSATGPLVVVNAAAYTAVDAAETDAERAYLVNATGPARLAAACAAHGAHLVQVSTDYVFAGDAGGANPVDGTTAPTSVYGASKLAGERAVLESDTSAHVVRTSWLYGAGGPNFVRSIARAQVDREFLTVVDDQRGNPTWTVDLAAGLVELALAADRVPRGVLHCAGTGTTTWFDLARAVLEELGEDPERVRPARTADLGRPAPRPANSELDLTSWTVAGLTPLPRWRDALHRAIAAGILA